MDVEWSHKYCCLAYSHNCVLPAPMCTCVQYVVSRSARPALLQMKEKDQPFDAKEGHNLKAKLKAQAKYSFSHQHRLS